MPVGAPACAVLDRSRLRHVRCRLGHVEHDERRVDIPDKPGEEVEIRTAAEEQHGLPAAGQHAEVVEGVAPAPTLVARRLLLECEVVSWRLGSRHF